MSVRNGKFPMEQLEETLKKAAAYKNSVESHTLKVGSTQKERNVGI